MKMQSFLKGFNKQYTPAGDDLNKVNDAIYPWYNFDISNAHTPDWPERPNGQSVDEYLLKKVNEIFAPYEDDFEEVSDDILYISTRVMKIFLNLSNDSQITNAHRFLFKRCSVKIKELIYEVFQDNPREITVKDIQGIREHVAQQAYEQKRLRQETLGAPASINAILLLDGIDQERVIEIGPGPDGAVTVPNRIDAPSW